MGRASFIAARARGARCGLADCMASRGRVRRGWEKGRGRTQGRAGYGAGELVPDGFCALLAQKRRGLARRLADGAP